LIASACTAIDVDQPAAVEAEEPETERERDQPENLSPAYVAGCDRISIGEDFGPLVAAYGVTRGRLNDSPCFGEPDPVVERAWTSLASAAPAALTDSVAVMAGFDSDGGDTAAYASSIDDDTEAFLIAIAVDAGQIDPEELQLTLAHELAHVFTQTTSQLDIAVFADECDTYFNGFGCFRDDAFITAWIDTFWSPQDLASLPIDGEADEPGGLVRCEANSGFVGSYAASHPEEDFAESFAAYVYGVDLPPAVQSRIDFFDGYTAFAEMRDNIRASGSDGLPNNFDTCG